MENNTETTAQNILEAFGLEGLNSEVFTRGDDVYITMEAPNNATVSTDVPVGASENQIKKAMIEAMYDFDADEEFTENWSCESGYAPSRFIDMLQKDEQFFETVADSMQPTMRERRNNPEGETRQWKLTRRVSATQTAIVELPATITTAEEAYGEVYRKGEPDWETVDMWPENSDPVITPAF